MTDIPPPPPPPPVPAKAKKKPFYKRIWVWLLAVVIIVIIAVSVSVNNGTSRKHTVTYSITGDGKTADVDYFQINGDGSSGTEQANGAALPWTKTVEGKGDFSSFTVTGQLKDGKSIGCAITVDGKQKAKQTSSGEFAVVDCTASP